MRMMAEQAVFALNGATLASSGNQIALSLYFPQNDPQVGWYMQKSRVLIQRLLAQFATNPVLQRLGQYIGQDHVRFDARSFQPWTSTQPGHQVQQQPFLQHPVPNLAAPQFGFFGQQPQQAPFGQMFGGGSGGGGNNLFPNLVFGNNPAPPQAAAQPNPVPNPSSDTLTEHTREWQPVEPVEQCTICLGDMDQGGGPCRQLNLCPHHFHRYFSQD